jgi:hypothetical protein
MISDQEDLCLVLPVGRRVISENFLVEVWRGSLAGGRRWASDPISRGRVLVGAVATGDVSDNDSLEVDTTDPNAEMTTTSPTLDVLSNRRVTCPS